MKTPYLLEVEIDRAFLPLLTGAAKKGAMTWQQTNQSGDWRTDRLDTG